ncbi:MAG: hypothetical protein MI750_15600, partial [Xanthomonadales bacterium]|nr:hypothetical protein [Xanthomonadales bacterium]
LNKTQASTRKDASAVIKGRMPFDHDRREGSVNRGITDVTPSAFRPFCRLGKGSRRHTAVYLKKTGLSGGETKTKRPAKTSKQCSTYERYQKSLAATRQCDYVHRSFRWRNQNKYF